MIYMDVKDNLAEKVVYDYADCQASIHYDSLSLYPNCSGISHWHDDIELILILSGEMQYNVNGKIFMLHENEGIFASCCTRSSCVPLLPTKKASSFRLPETTKLPVHCFPLIFPGKKKSWSRSVFSLTTERKKQPL